LYDDIAKDDEELSNALQAGGDSTDNIDLGNFIGNTK